MCVLQVLDTREAELRACLEQQRQQLAAGEKRAAELRARIAAKEGVEELEPVQVDAHFDVIIVGAGTSEGHSNPQPPASCPPAR